MLATKSVVNEPVVNESITSTCIGAVKGCAPCYGQEHESCKARIEIGQAKLNVIRRHLEPGLMACWKCGHIDQARQFSFPLKCWAPRFGDPVCPWCGVDLRDGGYVDVCGELHLGK
ncbi:MAG: hypothetical protein M1343_13120 [Chloroflexi bacterium]|nr:hypothetical protein [Chloroflexota bacterium]